jgi:hypothetical protein
VLAADSITRAYFFQTGTPQTSSLVTHPIRFSSDCDQSAEPNATIPPEAGGQGDAYARAASALSPFAGIVSTFTA